MFLSLLNKCLMPRTWCALLTPDTEDIWQLVLCSEVELLQKKLTNKCWTCKTRTQVTLLSGFPTTSRVPFVIFLPMVWKCLQLSLVIPRPFKKCSRELLSSLQPCSEEKHFCIGTLEKEWMKWNSLRQKVTWTILLVNINNIKKLQLMMRMKKTKMKKMKKQLDYYFQNKLFNFL